MRSPGAGRGGREASPCWLILDERGGQVLGAALEEPLSGFASQLLRARVSSHPSSPAPSLCSGGREIVPQSRPLWFPLTPLVPLLHPTMQ